MTAAAGSELRNPYSIHELPRTERPRERLRTLGAQSLTTGELLAIVLGSGGRGRPALTLAQELLATADGSLRRLALQPVAALTTVGGVGEARAVCVHARCFIALRPTSGWLFGSRHRRKAFPTGRRSPGLQPDGKLLPTLTM